MFKGISWSRGFFRLWVFYGVIVVVVTSVNIYDETPYMPKRTLIYSEKFDEFRPKSERLFEEAVERKLISTYEVENDTLGFTKDIPKKTKELEISKYIKSYKSLYDSKLLDERMEIASMGLGFLFVPFVIGLGIKWVLMGFRRKEAADN